MPPTVRAATEADFAALEAMDLTYSTARFLSLIRAGSPPEHTFSFVWRDGEPGEAVYQHYTEEFSRRAFEGGADLFLVAEVDGRIVGLLMVVLPKWTDAGEITDLAVDRRFRRHGAGRALVQAAVAWARERNLRALWVEPRANFAGAIEFYLSMGFRLSGFSDRLYSNADDEDGRPTIYLHLELDRGTS
jgi:ribosomal protein S18 acetylase RimI-like enzyme